MSSVMLAVSFALTELTSIILAKQDLGGQKKLQHVARAENASSTGCASHSYKSVAQPTGVQRSVSHMHTINLDPSVSEDSLKGNDSALLDRNHS